MNWFRFYHEALDDPKVQRLSGDTFKAWINILCLASRNNPRGALPPVEDIGFALRVSTDAAQSIIDELVRVGLVDAGDDALEPHNWAERQRVSDTSNDRVARYRAKNRDNNDGNVTGNVTGNDDVTDVKRKCNGLEQNREEKKRTEPPKSPTGDETAPLTVIDGGRTPTPAERRFDLFWKAYPRRTGKQAALKIWQRLRPDDDMTARMIEAVGMQKKSRDWQKDGGQYIPNPATWLNQGRWDDDPIFGEYEKRIPYNSPRAKGPVF